MEGIPLEYKNGKRFLHICFLTCSLIRIGVPRGVIVKSPASLAVPQQLQTGLPGMIGMTGMPGMPGMSGMLGMPGMPGIPYVPGMSPQQHIAAVLAARGLGPSAFGLGGSSHVTPGIQGLMSVHGTVGDAGVCSSSGGIKNRFKTSYSTNIRIFSALSFFSPF